MAHITFTPTVTPVTEVLMRPLRRSLRAVGNFMVSTMDSNSRIQLVNQLNAMSDVQLAELGVKRDEIVQHVFKDTFYI